MELFRIYAVHLGSATVLLVLTVGLIAGIAPMLSSLVYRALRAEPGFTHLIDRRALSVSAGVLCFLLPAFVYVVTSSLVFGLASLVFVPLILGGWYRWQTFRWQERLERSALTYLATLQGLIGVGYGLPTALRELSQALPGPFAEILNGYLGGFDRGRSLQETLDRFRRGTGLKNLGLYLALLEMCYRSGLSVGPMLQRILPLLTREESLRVRIRSARKNAGAQAGLAFCLPWFVFAVLTFFQPNVGLEFLQWSFAVPILLLTVGLECLGVYSLWQISRFY